MSDNNSESASGEPSGAESTVKIQEQSLEKMEALLKQAAKGIHILFDNSTIAEIMSKEFNEKDFFDFDKMKAVQDAMTDLIGKKTYFEKMAYLSELNRPAYEMLVRTYFHIVENTIKNDFEFNH